MLDSESEFENKTPVKNQLLSTNIFEIFKGDESDGKGLISESRPRIKHWGTLVEYFLKEFVIVFFIEVIYIISFHRKKISSLQKVVLDRRWYKQVGIIV